MGQNKYNEALQKPAGSGFNAVSTASDVIKSINLTGKITIIACGYAGIGLETTKTLAAAGATVIVPVITWMYAPYQHLTNALIIVE
jgi:hypothetical protein